MGKTAAEVMSDLSKNTEYLAKKKVIDEHFSNLDKAYSKDEKELISELNQAGFVVNSVWDFVNSKNDYIEAAPILIKHLKLKHHPKTLAGIARSLAVPNFSNDDELWSLLIELFEKTSSDIEIALPEERGLQQSIAITLDCLANYSRVDDLKLLIKNNRKADGIHWLQDKLNELS